MMRYPSTVGGAEENATFEPSTAPTSPEGSLTFSPAFQATRLTEAFDRISLDSMLGTRTNGSSLSASVDGEHTSAVRNVCYVGAGYVGGPSAAVMALHNPSICITVVDRDESRIRRWNSAHLPIYEPDLNDVVRLARDGADACTFANRPTTTASADQPTAGPDTDDGLVKEISLPMRLPNLFFSTDVARCIREADIVFVAVNTPTKIRGQGAGCATDMSAFESVCVEIALNAKEGAIFVEKSTVPCGTARTFSAIVESHRPGLNFEILSNPEFMAEGTAVKDLLTPDRVIIGCANSASGRQAAAALSEVYAAWVPRSRIVPINIWSSELSKLVANAMLAQRISSINSISAICEKTGADIGDIAKSIGLDPRIGPQYLKAGLGFGGSCFKKDTLSLIYLAQSLNLDEVADYWQQVLNINEYQRDRFVRRVLKKMNNTLRRKKIAILGYAFKKNTSDTRESPAVDVIRTLLEDTPAEIAIFDPCCNPEAVKMEIKRSLSDMQMELFAPTGPIRVYREPYEACSSASAVLILTDWDEFRNTSSPCSKNSKKARSPTKTRPVTPDPRPFKASEPTEIELLALHKHLVANQSSLGRYRTEGVCDEGCPDCQEKGQKAYSRVGEQLDWAKISYHLMKPKVVFDGRGILDVAAMEHLGVRVESIGREYSGNVMA